MGSLIFAPICNCSKYSSDLEWCKVVKLIYSTREFAKRFVEFAKTFVALKRERESM